jgi:hypothetical protein
MRDITGQLLRKLERLEAARDQKNGMTDAELLRQVNANIEAGNALRRTLFPDVQPTDHPPVEGVWLASLSPAQVRDVQRSIEANCRAAGCEVTNKEGRPRSGHGN